MWLLRYNGCPMRAVLIVNPIAGRGRGIRAAADAAEVLREHGWSIEARQTSGPGHATELASQASADVDVVVSVGGDGTLSETLSGLLTSKTPCGLIPCGTGNDFARFVGINPSARGAAEQIAHGSAWPIDVAAVNDGQKHFVNVLGIGFDAAVAARINRRRRVSAGLWAYMPAILSEVACRSHLQATVEVDGRLFEDDWLLVAVANGNAYGSGFRIAPEACCDDGLLDVILVRGSGRIEILRNLWLARQGKHLAHPKVIMARGRSIRIRTQVPAPVMTDGDVGLCTPIQIEAVPGAALLWK